MFMISTEIYFFCQMTIVSLLLIELDYHKLSLIFSYRDIENKLASGFHLTSPVMYFQRLLEPARLEVFGAFFKVIII